MALKACFGHWRQAMIDTIGARDETFGMFRAAWNAGAAAIVGSIPEIKYQDIATGPAHNYWARISMVTAQERQTALPGDDIHRVNTVDGQLFIEVFAPKAAAIAQDAGNRLALLARDAFKFRRSNPSGAVVYRNTRVEQMPSRDTWLLFRMVSDYSFDELITL